MAITTIVFIISVMAVIAAASLLDSNTNNNISFAKKGEAALHIFSQYLAHQRP
jgi:hypothetical protein